MISNYFKAAWRNLWKNKVFSVINIMGLALGLACSLLILLWVRDELGIDAFHAGGKQLYTVYERQYYDHKVQGQYYTPGMLADELKKEIPEIKNAVNYTGDDKRNFQVGEKIIKFSGAFSGADFFKMFSYPLLQGTASSALNSPVSIAISKNMADEFFGSPAGAMGKTIKYQNQKVFTVAAVFANLPGNSSLKFDYLINWTAFLNDNSWAKAWDNNGPSTYILLRNTADAALVAGKLTHFLDKYDKFQKKGVFTEELGIQRFDQGYLHSSFIDGNPIGGRIGYVRLFSMVALFILLIACINFMNLTTARSAQRSREIGVRKVIGALRSSLIRQFIGESMLFTVLAVCAALLLMVLLLPVFNEVTQKQISLPFNRLSFWAQLTGITLVTGLISGSYPALVLSSFKPVQVLKGTIAKQGSGAALFRKGLVVFQFVLSIVLIIATVVISKQVNFLQKQNLGYDRENLIYFPLEGSLNAKFDLFRNEALQMPGIQSITHISNDPANIINNTGGVDWDKKDPNLVVRFTQVQVGYNFVPTLKLKLLQGRDYSRSFATDSTGYLINETALQRISYTDPVGKTITLHGRKGVIIGVLKDFHFTSLHDQITPLIISLQPEHIYGNAIIRTKPGETRQALASLKDICQKINPDFQFTPYFLDEQYQKLYNNEQIIGELANVFAALAIVISCLGLLGLATFTAGQRVKEIGIRKILGASVSSLFALLSSEFLGLVCIALLIASPLAWYAMYQWLQGYAYHTRIEWWIFAIAGCMALLITLLTVSFQAAKVALINPVKSLRSE